MHDAGFVVTGYLLTAGALGAYVGSLAVRGRRARRRAEVIAARRDRTPRP